VQDGEGNHAPTAGAGGRGRCEVRGEDLAEDAAEGIAVDPSG
jgi:hypothetical protein